MCKNILEEHSPDCLLQVWITVDCNRKPCVAFQFSSETVHVPITEGFQIHRCNEFLRQVVQEINMNIDVTFITYGQYAEMLSSISRNIFGRLCEACK